MEKSFSKFSILHGQGKTVVRLLLDDNLLEKYHRVSYCHKAIQITVRYVDCQFQCFHRDQQRNPFLISVNRRVSYELSLTQSCTLIIIRGTKVSVAT